METNYIFDVKENNVILFSREDVEENYDNDKKNSAAREK